MKFKTLNGKIRTIRNVRNYLIDWDGGCRSKFQSSVKAFLRKYWEKDVVFEELKVVGTRLSLDIYNANRKIAVEVQGRQHLKFVPFFHGTRLGYLDQLKRDEKKLEFCEMNGIKLVEIYPDDEISKEIFLRFGVEL
jgi:hypothetical protein